MLVHLSSKGACFETALIHTREQHRLVKFLRIFSSKTNQPTCSIPGLLDNTAVQTFLRSAVSPMSEVLSGDFDLRVPVVTAVIDSYTQLSVSDVVVELVVSCRQELIGSVWRLLGRLSVRLLCCSCCFCLVLWVWPISIYGSANPCCSGCLKPVTYEMILHLSLLGSFNDPRRDG